MKPTTTPIPKTQAREGRTLWGRLFSSLPHRIMLAMMIFILLMQTAFIYVLHTQNEKTLIAAGQDRALSLIHTMDSAIDDNASAQSIQSTIDKLVKSEPSILELNVYDLHNSLLNIAAMNHTEIGGRADPEDVKAAQSDRFVSIYKKGKLDITAPIHDKNGKVNYVLGTQFSLDHEIEKVNALVTKMIIAGILSLVLCFVIFTAVLRSLISKPLLQVVAVANHISDGNLTFEQARSHRTDEIGQLSRAFHDMAAQLRTIIGDVRHSSDNIAQAMKQLTLDATHTSDAASRISTVMQEIASGSEVQVRTSDENAKAMEEMSYGIQRIAEVSSEVAGASSEASEDIRHGHAAVQEATSQMQTIGSTIQGLHALIEGLDAKSADIHGFAAIITDIASQTGLLSLNAAIEAARAGEEGRGFAVVAGEVKKLASQSSDSANQVAMMVASMQAETKKFSIFMEKISGEVQQGMQSVNGAGHSFERILGQVHSVNEQIQEVSAASQEMSAGTEQVNASVDEMARISRNSFNHTKESLSSIEQQLENMQNILATANNLHLLIDGLKTKVDHFKV